MNMQTFKTPKTVMRHTRPVADPGKWPMGIIQIASKTFWLYRSRARTAEAGGPSMVPPVGMEQPSVDHGTWSVLPVLLQQLCPSMHSHLRPTPDCPVHLCSILIALSSCSGVSASSLGLGLPFAFSWLCVHHSVHAEGWFVTYNFEQGQLLQ